MVIMSVCPTSRILHEENGDQPSFPHSMTSFLHLTSHSTSSLHPAMNLLPCFSQSSMRFILMLTTKQPPRMVFIFWCVTLPVYSLESTSFHDIDILLYPGIQSGQRKTVQCRHQCTQNAGWLHQNPRRRRAQELASLGIAWGWAAFLQIPISYGFSNRSRRSRVSSKPPFYEK